MTLKNTSEQAQRKIRYIRIDPRDVDPDWIRSMRTPEEKQRDAEIAERVRQSLNLPK